jgi:hypothetical protein
MHLLDHGTHGSHAVPGSVTTPAGWWATWHRGSAVMITNDQELAVTRQRIQQLQDLLVRLRQCETAENYAAMVIAYLLEIDKMNEEVRCYLASLPTEQAEVVY